MSMDFQNLFPLQTKYNASYYKCCPANYAIVQKISRRGSVNVYYSVGCANSSLVITRREGVTYGSSVVFGYVYDAFVITPPDVQDVLAYPYSDVTNGNVCETAFLGVIGQPQISAMGASRDYCPACLSTSGVPGSCSAGCTDSLFLPEYVPATGALGTCIPQPSGISSASVPYYRCCIVYGNSLSDTCVPPNTACPVGTDAAVRVPDGQACYNGYCRMHITYNTPQNACPSYMNFVPS